MRSLRSLFSLAYFLALFFLHTGSAYPALGVISLEALTERAELIVYGKVKTKRSEIQEIEGGMPKKVRVTVSTTEIVPNKVLKGKPITIPLLVRMVQSIEDSPRFTVGEEAFFFLVRNKDESTYSTVGLVQGKYDVSGGMVIREKMAVELFLHRIEKLIDLQKSNTHIQNDNH